MPSITAGIGGASLLSGLIGGSKSDKAADQASEASEAELALAMKQDERQEEAWGMWKSDYYPAYQESVASWKRLMPEYEKAVEESLAAGLMDRETYEQYGPELLSQMMAESEVKADPYEISKAIADVDRSAERQIGSQRRALERRGIKPGDPGWNQGENQVAYAGMGAAAANNARWREDKWAESETNRRKQQLFGNLGGLRELNASNPPQAPNFSIPGVVDSPDYAGASSTALGLSDRYAGAQSNLSEGIGTLGGALAQSFGGFSGGSSSSPSMGYATSTPGGITSNLFQTAGGF